jgi:hypothetical protein
MALTIEHPLFGAGDARRDGPGSLLGPMDRQWTGAVVGHTSDAVMSHGESSLSGSAAA